MSELKSHRCDTLIAQQVGSADALAQEYAQESKKPLAGQVSESSLKGQAENVTLKGTIEKGEQKLIPLQGRSDPSEKVESPGEMSIRGWEYVAMPPTEFSMESIRKAYSDLNGKWHRGRHRIPVNIDLDGDHEGDAYDRYPLMWSIPGKMKLADSREAAPEIKGKIMLRNDRAELVETKDYYCVKIWDDHVDNLASNIRADGYIMHFDNKTQSWWRLSHLKYIFNHEDGRGTCYGPDVPCTSEWGAPDNHMNECPPTLYADPVDGDKKN